jgi:hypothetical protein
VLIVDSITHVWREVCEAYLAQMNEARAVQNKGKRSRLEFQDWVNIKRLWNPWTDFFLNSKLHIIICGRAGFEWDFEEREDTAGVLHKELIKTGVKMKVEAEFGFEPSLVVEMNRVQIPDESRKDGFRLAHRATVLKDRFSVLQGASVDSPTGAFFKPHLDMLTPGAHNAVDVTLKTPADVDASGDANWQRERRERTILCEEIQGELTSRWPGQSAAEKKAKADALQAYWGTRSWKAVETMNSDKLRAGLDALRAVTPVTPTPELPPAEDPAAKRSKKGGK